jgi:ribosome assembly protein 3
MRLMTTEFGDDLNSVRMSKDFGDKSLPMLVRALKQGVNIFDADEKRMVVGGAAE